MSVGNVGQLACDVLISSLNAQRVGFLYDDSTVPVVGSEPFVSLDAAQHRHHVTTAVEGVICHYFIVINLIYFFYFHTCCGSVMLGFETKKDKKTDVEWLEM